MFVCPVFIIFFKDEKKITSRDWGRGISKILKQYIKGEEKEEKVTHLGLILLNGSKAKQGGEKSRGLCTKNRKKKRVIYSQLVSYHTTKNVTCRTFALNGIILPCAPFNRLSV